ncbi:MAG: TIGR02680 family protein [Sporolactobacillus sp.]
MSDEKWQLNRAGLINFWYYDVAVFDFADGKMLLRGANGSGKSVTMASLITVLLDGKKTPDRLDPFGSSARKMEDYLLGEEDVSHRQERTGYLYLEYKRKGLDQYITTGMGMQARRHKSMTTWYFVLTDNRRIGMDLELYRQASSHEIVPLTRQELSNRIGGQLISSQQEYMRRVNELIFGFDNSDIYDDLIKLLLQLRRPKLSKEFKPTVMYDILQQSLPALKADDLQSVADTLEQIDQTRQQLAQASHELKLMRELSASYEKYRSYCLSELASHLSNTDEQRKTSEAKWQEITAERQRLTDQLADERADYQALEQKVAVLAKEKDDLSHHEVFRLASDQNETRRAIGETEVKLDKQEEKLSRKQAQLDELKRKIEAQETELEELDRERGQLRLEMDDLAEAAHYHEHVAFVSDEARQENGETFAYWKKTVKDFLSHLRDVLKLLTDYEQKREALQREDKRLGEQIQKIAGIDMDIRQWQQNVAAEKERLQIALQKWRGTLQFPVDDGQWAQLLQNMDDLYDEMMLFDDALQPLRDALQAAEKDVQMQDAALAEREQAEHDQQTQLKDEREAWQQKKDPEPERSEEQQAYRAALAARGVEARPFYALIDFVTDTPQSVRNFLEAALREAGYLDALICADDLQLEADRQLKPNPELQLFRQTLSEYLVPDCPEGTTISAELVQSVIDSIQLEGEDALIIDEHGRYHLPALEGQASAQYQATFIGKASRDAFRLREIERLNEEIEQSAARAAELAEKRAALAARLDEFHAEMAAHPSDMDLKFAWQQRVAKEAEREQETRYKERIEAGLNQLKHEAAFLKNKLNETAASDQLPLELNAYHAAETAAFEYQEALADYINQSDQRRRIKKLMTAYTDQRTASQEEFEDYFQEQADLRATAQKLRLAAESIAEQLKLKNADEVTRRLQQVISEWEDGQRRLPKLAAAITTHEIQVTQLTADDARLKERSLFFAQLSEEWAELFRRAQALGQPDAAPPPDAIDGLVHEALKNFKPDTDRKKRLEDDFETKFRSDYGMLLDYHLQINDRKMTDEKDWMHALVSNDLTPYLDQWREKTHQLVFECDYQGARVSPRFVIEQLDRLISQQSVMLETRDQQLFEDIIFHSVGVTLRSLINRSEKWVQQMNAILSSRNNSSHLKLRISWKPLAAETDEELDTQQLVTLLRRDAQLLAPDDLEKMVRHFRAKIEACKARVQEEENTLTFDQVLREVLDYRQWFTFQIDYQKSGEPRRPLTNHRFFTFSGGEKAVAMYLPLYTAVYARYQDAGKNAPYIIALDEAFAGVDELNIAEQFATIEQLGFNYIMNSQALFGDYETVPALNIYELIHPEKQDFVTVIAYTWNGSEKVLIGSTAEVSADEP